MFGVRSMDDHDPNGPHGIVVIEKIGEPNFQQEGPKSFYVCPHCGAKNITHTRPSKHEGLYTAELDHWED